MTTGISQPFIRASEPAAAHGPGLRLPVLRVLQQGGADVGAPAVPQSLGGDGGVLFDLPSHRGQDGVYWNGFSECDDVPDVQHGLVLQMILGVAGHRQLLQDLPVLFHVDDVGVVVGHPDAGAVLPQPAVSRMSSMQGVSGQVTRMGVLSR